MTRRSAQEWADAASLRRKGNEYVGPCPLCGGTDRFHVLDGDDGALVGCRGCIDGAADAVRAERFTQLVRMLWPDDGAPSAPRPPAAPKAVKAVKRVDALPEDLRLWRYHNAAGEVVLAVGRRDWVDKATGEARKSYPQFTPAPDGGWFIKGMAGKRPLYKLPELLASTGRVAVVEGEKCADAVAATWGQVATTWAGGSNAWQMSDWTPLRGRAVSILADADEAGRKAARGIAVVLRELGCDILLALPEGEDGEDVADWISKESPSGAANRVKSLLQPFSEPPSAPEPEELAAASTDWMEDNPHFKVLGLERLMVLIRIKMPGQIDRKTRSQLTQPSSLIDIAPVEWWCTRTGAGELTRRVSQAVGSALIRIADRRGQVDVSHAHGRGAVRLSDGGVVYHLGDRLLFEGAMHSVDAEIDDRQWLAEPSVRLADSATDAQMKELAEALIAYRWASDMHCRRMLGWIGAALAGGGLSWRPHILFVAPSASGKSWMLDRIQEVFGPLTERIADASAAAIARLMAHTSIPLIVDEAEANAAWITSVMEQLRIATGADGDRIRADQTGSGIIRQHLRFAALLSTTTAPRLSRQDETRFSMVGLGEGVEDWPAVERRIFAALENASAIRARLVRESESIAREATRLAREYMTLGMESREALASASLGAGWRAWGVDDKDVYATDRTSIDRESGAGDLLGFILALRHRRQHEEVDLLGLLDKEPEMAATLYGLRLYRDSLMVAIGHYGLQTALSRSVYANADLRSLLLQLPATAMSQNGVRFGSRKHKAVEISTETLHALGIRLHGEED